MISALWTVAKVVAAAYVLYWLAVFLFLVFVGLSL